MKKSIALLIIALLVLPALSFATPVRASTGQPWLGAIDVPNLDLWTSNTTVAIKAGNLEVASVDGSPVSGYWFALIFDYNGTQLVDFSGAQMDLYISKDGYSSISADDKLYARGFSVSELSLALDPARMNNKTLGDDAFFMKDEVTSFWLGTATVTDMATAEEVPVKVLIGNIPFDITSDYKYIKINDGTATLVAVSRQYITVLASLSLTPTSGPGGALVTLKGTALASNAMYNITYNNSTTAAAQVTTGADGKFTFSWNVFDVCDNFCSETVYIDVWKTNGSYVDTVTYDLIYREIIYVETGYGSWSNVGNETNYPIDTEVFDDFNVVGNWFNPQGPVEIAIGGITVAVVDTNASGFFNTTFTVPELPIGYHNMTFMNSGCKYWFTVYVNPTLIVTPDMGPIGTEVFFTCYGFPANSEITLFWYVGPFCDYDYDWLAIMNVTTGPDGKFNVTTDFVVPKQFGGDHTIHAFYVTNVTGTNDIYSLPVYPPIASTQFYVTPTIWATPASFAADGTTFWINGSGLDPEAFYIINIDNQAFAMPTMMDYYEAYGEIYGWWAQDYYSINGYYDYVDLYDDSWNWMGSAGPLGGDWWGSIWVPIRTQPDGHYVVADHCGDLAIQVVKAGFRPGVHTVALYESESAGWYPISSYATFTVTTEGDPVIGDITANITAALAGVNAKLTAIEGEIATIQTDVGTLKVSVNALDAKVVALQGSVATVQTTLGTMTGTLTSVAGDMATVKTQVGTINANVASVKSFLPVDMMPVWIAVIFAIIAAIASIYAVIVIRSKIAQ